MDKVTCEFKGKELKLKDVVSLPLRFQDRGNDCFDIETADGDTFAKNLDKETAVLYCRAFNGYDSLIECSEFLEQEDKTQKQELKKANADADKFEKALHELYESGCLNSDGIAIYRKALEQ
ncbi:hypothetical protein VCHA53O466_50410 [Vibrio chagasii]|nr:hypothetical protein VCHA53O466_50410 [Vibrio chagasii]